MRKFAAALLTASMLGLVILTPAAAKAAADTPEITITTDKDSYQVGENVNATISIDNGTDKNISGIDLKGSVPEGFNVEGAKDSVWTLAENETIEAGTKKSYSLNLISKEGKAASKADVTPAKKDEPVNEQNKVQTGDTAKIGIYICLLMASLSGIILIGRSKRSRKILSIIIAAGLSAGFLLTDTLNVKAAEPDAIKEIKKVTMIKVGEDTISLQVVVSYKEETGMSGEGMSQESDSPEKNNTLSYEGYNLLWADEFDGTSLDRNCWNVELHEKAWVNGEDQEYVDSDENIFIRDGKLILQSHEDPSGRITSGRVNTQGKIDFKYGLVEAYCKVPEGQGFLPAFWLMPTNENLYGQWPRCGEIDAMEVKGQSTNEVLGTIHYGNPHMQSQGAGSAVGGSFSDSYHKFTVEWEPGKITWYVDGVKYHEENDWFTTTEGAGTASYPAPFDQNFYVILNLAVGNDWAGEVGEGVQVDGAEFCIDYVRVYQKDSYDENVTKPEKGESQLREPNADGNYLNNGDFSVAESLTDDVDWKFMTQEGGEATAEIKDKKITIKPTADGTVDYSIQLVQAGIPLVKGATYRVTFDGIAKAKRTIKVAVKAPDRGWAEYLTAKTVELDTKLNSYSYEFKMTADTDANARFEYEIGKAGSLAEFSLSNIRLEKVSDPDPEEMNKKTVLATGDYVYNGGFDQGNNRLGYWEISEDDKANVKVTSEGKDGTIHRAKILKAKTTIKESALAIKEEGTYALSFKAESEGSSKVSVTLAGVKNEVEVTSDNKRFDLKVTVPEGAKDKDLVIVLLDGDLVYLDDISVTEDAMIKNGSFNAGVAGWEAYIDSNADASFVIDSQSEDNAADFTINGTGADDWRIQLKQTGINLEKGKWYKFRFKVKSSLPRQMRAILQGDEAHGWAAYSGENIVDLTEEYQTFEKIFCMTSNTDEGAFVSFCLGKVGESEINIQHRVCIDDISLVEIEKPADMEQPELAPDPVEEEKKNSQENSGSKDEKEEVPAGENKLSNADFTDGLDGWTNVICDGGEATTEISDGKLIYHITNSGNQDYSIQLKKEGLSLANGKKYRVSYKIRSSVARQIKSGMMSKSYSWYGGSDPNLNADEEKEVSFEFTMNSDDNSAQLYISLGKAGSDTPLAADITISDISLVEVTN